MKFQFCWTHDPIFKKLEYEIHKFLMDEFSSKTVKLIPKKLANKGYDRVS